MTPRATTKPVTPPPDILPPQIPEESRGRLALAQLYLIQGPIVSLPPQTFNGEFLPTGKARVVLSGKRLLTGDFELLGAIELIKEKYEPRLIRNPDSLKSPRGANTKGFAALSDGTGTELECLYDQQGHWPRRRHLRR